MDTARQFSLRLAELLRHEHSAMAEFLVALSEFDRDRGWVVLGYTSLFHYLTRELRLPKGPAFYRMTAAHLIQEYPEVVDPLRDGRLCLSTVAEVSNVITRENVGVVLPRFFGASKQEAKEIAAELAPTPVPARTVVTPIAAPVAAAAPAVPPEGLRHAPEPSLTGGRGADDLVLPEEPPAPAEPPPRPSHAASARAAPAHPTRAVVEPKTADLSRMHVTVSRRLLEKLDAARDALSHSRPNATDDEILEAGLDLLLARDRKRHGLVEKPRKTPPPSSGDDIPAHVQREVMIRDGGRCAYPLAGGGVCGSTEQLQFDHIIPKALGGKPTVANTRLRCRFHNIVEARRVFGDHVMDRYTSAGRGPASLSGPGPAS